MPNAVLFDILEAIRADIQGLNLAGLAAANVVIQKVPADRVKDLPAVRFPCVIIAPFGSETLDPQAGTNARDDVVYPVLVAILVSEKDEQELPASEQQGRFNQYLVWRETIRRSFHNQRLTAALCLTVQVQPLEIVDRPTWLGRSLLAGGMVLRCFSREPRG